MLAPDDVLQLVHEMASALDADLSLDRLAERSGWSPFHFHRAFRRVVGETPKQYALRLRIERAAGELATTRAPVRDVAMQFGFASHEVFTRAFGRHFGHSPSAHRARVQGELPRAARTLHRAIVHDAGPCLRLFHLPLRLPRTETRRSAMPTLSIVRKEIAAQPVVLVRLRTSRDQLAAAIAEGAGKSYVHAQKAGCTFAGHPFTRYLSMGPGLMSIEVGMPLTAPATGAGDVVAAELPGGPVAMAVHAGPYDQLAETWTTVERWMETNGHRAGGAPWELYVTDPAEHPDPKDWRTEVYWPLDK